MTKKVEKKTEKKAAGKVCSRCKEDKPTQSFGSHRSAKDGKNPYCLECARSAAKESRERRAAAHEKAVAEGKVGADVENPGKVDAPGKDAVRDAEGE